MANFNLTQKQLTAKLYNLRSAVESIISMLKEDILTPEQAYDGMQKRYQAIMNDGSNTEKEEF